MLAIARPKLEGLDAVRFALLDAENLHQIADASIDICSMSFGMKICDRQKVMREVYRVLRPGGRFYCLEAARITVPGLHTLYLAYMSWCAPHRPHRHRRRSQRLSLSAARHSRFP